MDDCSVSNLVTDQKIKISSISPLDTFRFCLCIAYNLSLCSAAVMNTYIKEISFVLG